MFKQTGFSKAIAFCFVLLTASWAHGADRVMQVAPQATQLKSQAMQLNEVEILRSQNVRLKALVKELGSRLEEIKLEKPFCKDLALSANKAGASRDCSPYACDPVPGLCMNRCAITDHCAPGAICDTSNGQCVYVR